MKAALVRHCLGAAQPAGYSGPMTPGKKELRQRRRRRRVLVLIVAVALAPTDGLPARPAMSHAACLALAERDPERALATADWWSADGGDPAAAQCAAAALFVLGRYDDAARRLDALAERPYAPALRAALLAQAARAWLVAEAPAAARAAIDRALALVPDDPTLLTDRAEVRAQDGDYQGAIGDLSAALAREPRSADALVFRASASRRLGRMDAALADLAAALAIQPRHAEGLLERGVIRNIKGDHEGAREDWQAVVGSAPGTPAAEVAIGYLAQSMR